MKTKRSGSRGCTDELRPFRVFSWPLFYMCMYPAWDLYFTSVWAYLRLLWWLISKESACNAGDHLQYRRCSFNPWVRKVPWGRKWQPIPVYLPRKSHGHPPTPKKKQWLSKLGSLPGKSHGLRSLVGYSPWGC